VKLTGPADDFVFDDSQPLEWVLAPASWLGTDDGGLLSFSQRIRRDAESERHRTAEAFLRYNDRTLSVAELVDYNLLVMKNSRPEPSRGLLGNCLPDRERMLVQRTQSNIRSLGASAIPHLQAALRQPEFYVIRAEIQAILAEHQ
jgi:hypothetical protein